MINVIKGKNRKAQEEIVGFVLIVVLVAIVGVIFLGLALKQKTMPSENPEIKNLLGTTLAYTTRCAIAFEPQYSSLRDLIKNCYNSENCINMSMSSCDYMKEVTQEIFDSSITQNELEEGTISGYILDISYSIDNRTNSIFNITKECIGSKAGAEEIIPTDVSDIRVRLTFCYK